MIAYWERDCEWMGEGLQLAICPSFTGPTSLAALDVSGRGNPGTLTNMDRNTSWVTSGGKGALDFDGTNDIINTQPTTLFNRVLGQELTASIWINFKRLSGYQTILGARSSNSSFNWMLYQYISDGSIQLHGSSQNKSTYVPILNTWTHIAATVTNSGVYTLFANGNIVQGPQAFNFSGGNPNVLTIGGYPNGEFFLGQIDDIRIYNRALTAPEVRQLYERDRGGGMLHQPPKRRSVFIAAGFRAYWHRRQSQLIGGGL